MFIKKLGISVEEQAELELMKAIVERTDAQALFTAVVTDTLIDDFDAEGEMNHVSED